MKGVVWPLIVTMAIQALVSMAVFSPPVFAPAAHGDIGFPAAWIGVLTAATGRSRGKTYLMNADWRLASCQRPSRLTQTLR